MKIKLTGRVAYRFHKQLFSKPVLVLQVEQEIVLEQNEVQVDHPIHNRITWRDADLRDLTEIGAIHPSLLTLSNNLAPSGGR